MEQIIFSRHFAKRLLYLAAVTVLFSCILSLVLTEAMSVNDAPAWTTPSTKTIRRVAGTTLVQNEPNFLNNLDCMPVTYRLAGTSTMQAGCFTEAAFGLIDTDSDTAIFNGSDEGLPMLPHTPHQILVPWPKTLDLIGLDPIDNGGVLISLYKNVFAALQDQYNFLGQLTAKRLDRAPDINLKDPAGKPLVINPQTMAFSDGGSWLVAETMGGSFVRINLATLSTTAFAQSYGSQGSPALLKSRVTISEDGRFIAIANDLAEAFKVYDLATCDGVINGLRPQNCRSYDYQPFARQQISGLQSIRHLHFVNEGLLSFDAVTSNPDNNGSYELAPTASITSLTDYIGLGDSYTSGEGAFDYLDSTDTTDNACHLSRNSYPLLLTHDLFSNAGGHSVACSGATINDLGSTSNNYRGQIKNGLSLEQLQQPQAQLLELVETNFIPGYVAQQRFVQRWQPRIVTVAVGGNDIGFGNILQNCVEPHVSRHISGNTCYNAYEDRLELIRLIDRTIPRWTALYKQLRREAPGTQLYAIGYPQLADYTGNCALNVHLNRSELEFAANIIDYLNWDIKKAAAASDIPYIDIAQSLAGHRLCEAASYDIAVNGLTAGTDAGPFGSRIFGKESYHPNALGQSLIEQAILKQTHNFTGVKPIKTDIVDPASELLDAPRSGRPINTLIPDTTMTNDIVKRGTSVSVQARSIDDGLHRNTVYTVRLDGPIGPVLGTLMSDSVGDVQGSIDLPANIAAGGHTLDVIGLSQDGGTVDVTRPIYIPVSDTDTDGDGIDDMTDTCPGALNSNQDSDRDGIDDICDGLIGIFSESRGLSSLTDQSKNQKISPLSKGSSTHILGANTISVSIGGRYALKSPVKDAPRHKTTHRFCQMIFIIILGLLLLVKRYVKKGRFRLQ